MGEQTPKSGQEIVEEGARLSAKMMGIRDTKIDERVPGWKSEDMAKMQRESETSAEQLELLGQAREALASELHEDWRKTRLQDDGSFEPRVKTTKDSEWIAAHGGASEVDIANTSFADLPADWQAENRAAAEVVVGIMVDMNGDVDLDNPIVREEVGSKVHDAWLGRNEWAKEGELGVPFGELSAEEQAKDIAQIEAAQRIFISTESAE